MHGATLVSAPSTVSVARLSARRVGRAPRLARAAAPAVRSSRRVGVVRASIQEPGTDAEIKKFAADKGFAQGDPGVNMMAKVDVNGADASPVWNFLKEQTNSGDVSWNFAAKFIVNKDGDVVERNGNGAGDSRALIESLL